MGKTKTVKKGTKKEDLSASKTESLNIWSKLKHEPVPYIFFGIIIGLKIYHLIHFIIVVNFSYIFSLLPKVGSGGGITLTVSNSLGRLTYNIVAILFDALVVTTYLIRRKPTGKAVGFWERCYPLITILFPMIGFTYLLYSPYQVGSFLMNFDLPVLFPLMVELTGLVLSFIGATLSIAALWNLKRCFSLMVEVRQLVSTGMYRYIRHPLYMSEIIHAVGTAILFAHPVAIGIFMITLVLEIIRAKLEERKFLRLIPEYADFKKRTGFLWPKFW